MANESDGFDGFVDTEFDDCIDLEFVLLDPQVDVIEPVILHGTTEPTIVKAMFVGKSLSFRGGWGSGVIMAEFSDGTFADVAWFYTDEKDYSGCEFLGMTKKQASQKFHEDDGMYLRS